MFLALHFFFDKVSDPSICDLSDSNSFTFFSHPNKLIICLPLSLSYLRGFLDILDCLRDERVESINDRSSRNFSS